jgi:hypothetical protein
MKHLVLALMAAAGLGISSQAAHAGSDIYYMHGSACSKTVPSADNIQYGATNTNPGTAIFLCPFVTHAASGNATSASLRVRGYDRNPNADLGCTLTATDFYGSVIGTAENHLTTASQQSGQTFKVSLNNLGSSSDTKVFFVTCLVPTSSAMGLSHLTSLVLTVTSD